MVDLSTRVEEPDWLDSRPLSPAELDRALRFMERANRLLGGHACVVRHFEDWSRHWTKGETVHVLDAAVGAGDLLLALRQWADRRGWRLALTGIDAAVGVVDRARKRLRGRDIELRQEDLVRFSHGGRKFHYVMASMLLSHVPARRQAEALQAIDRLASRGVVVSDLQRTRPAYWGVRALTAAFGDRIMRHDGPLLVRRGFTLAELADAARKALLPYLGARSEPFFRATLAGEKSA